MKSLCVQGLRTEAIFHSLLLQGVTVLETNRLIRIIFAMVVSQAHGQGPLHIPILDKDGGSELASNS
jgi:hypothetical protein